MNTTIVKLSFLAPVHFGEGRLSDSLYTCDAATLFSALYIEALKMGAPDTLLRAAEQGDLSLSDAFPFIGDALYLPKPMIAPGTFEQRPGKEGDSRERKANKKLAYIPSRRFDDYMAGKLNVIAELEHFRPGVASVQAKVNLERRGGPDAEPYFVGGFSFAQDAGLYFIVQGTFNLTPVLEQLSYSGIGGKRSSGYGRFTFSTMPATELGRNLAMPRPGRTSMLLSSASPRDNELTNELLEGARYRLIRKGGFVQSPTHSANPQKKRDLYLFAAGSTFTSHFSGDVFDVNATLGAHPVYRYARALWMEV